jgi:outer membrane protein OmpU
MKKILLTTTALTMVAGASFADVKVSGSARFSVTMAPSVAGTAGSLGYAVALTNADAAVTALDAALLAGTAVLGDFNLVGTTAAALAAETAPVAAVAASSTTQNRIRVNFKLSGETDGGLTFGGGTRLQTAGGGGTGVQGASVFVSNGTMTLTVGNTSGAVGNTIGIYANGGCGFSATNAYGSYCANVIDQANSAFTGSSSGGAGPNNVRADFALGMATVSVSGGTGLDTEIAVSADLGGVALGVGIDAGAGKAGGTYVTLGYNAGSVNLSLAAFNPKVGAQRYIVNATTAVGAGKIGMFVAKDTGGNRWGLNYGASLGGGASANVAIHNQTVAANGVRAGTTIVAGMTFGF